MASFAISETNKRFFYFHKNAKLYTEIYWSIFDRFFHFIIFKIFIKINEYRKKITVL